MSELEEGTRPQAPGNSRNNQERKPGFRISVSDVAFIAICTAATVFLRERLGFAVWVIPAAAGHFFLFCNVFRVRRSYELAWVAVFLCNVAGWAAADRFSWPVVLGIQAPFTLAVIAMEMRSPRYHGIFCRRINGRNLDAWLAEGNRHQASGNSQS